MGLHKQWYVSIIINTTHDIIIFKTMLYNCRLVKEYKITLFQSLPVTCTSLMKPPAPLLLCLAQTCSLSYMYQLPPRARSDKMSTSVLQLHEDFPYLCNPEFHYHVHNCLTLIPMLCQFNPVHIHSLFLQHTLLMRSESQDS